MPFRGYNRRGYRRMNNDKTLSDVILWMDPGKKEENWSLGGIQQLWNRLPKNDDIKQMIPITCDFYSDICVKLDIWNEM